MRRIALALSLIAASSASAFASIPTLTEDQLQPPEKQLLATLKASGTVDVGNFLITRTYVLQAKAALTDPVAAVNFHSKPKGFSINYLLPGDAGTINKAVSANIAAMASSLWA